MQFGRTININVRAGGVGIFGTFGLVFSVLVYKDWITLAEAGTLWATVKAAFQAYGWIGYLLILVPFFSLFAYHEYLWFFLIKQKNLEIQRIAEQRNRLEELILRKRGSSGFSE